ncbi:hypothetical protein HFO56_03300 [Rhizobium laguerreae]|uniref:hypothetical protein n=1 Tax=Rhizobium laguerreae TaxID=1076926 RepID=UPI001C90228F|nr:hypothetical protein [Rhizobium laguerreae]MBY3151414.1 hypothetical protein [Rhizobium laguerreae]
MTAPARFVSYQTIAQWHAFVSGSANHAVLDRRTTKVVVCLAPFEIWYVSLTEIHALTTLAEMQAKIRSAIEPVQESDEDSFEAMTKKYNPILRKISQQTIVSRGTVDEIFPMGGHADQRDYYFRQVVGSAEIEGLISTLGRRAVDENWQYERWLRHSLEHGKIVVEVKQDGDAEPAGFAIFAAQLSVEDYGDDEVEPQLYLAIDLAAIYISPSQRNRGFSEALSWAVAYHVELMVDDLKRLPKARRPPLEGEGLKAVFTGDAQSAGGARFLANTVEKIETNLEHIRFKAGWAGIVNVIDDINFTEFPDQGFDSNEPSVAMGKPRV